MRLNQYLARATGLSRRAADTVIAEGNVAINGNVAELGSQVGEDDAVSYNGRPVHAQTITTVMFHKPVGYVTSRRQQGNSQTIYALLPRTLQHLKPIGRLDKDTSGLLLLTNDGDLANRLMHPSYDKQKEYLVWLSRKLTPTELVTIASPGIEIGDGLSAFEVTPDKDHYRAVLSEGRNRQIRRTFDAIGASVTKLHRTRLDMLALGDLKSGEWRNITEELR